MARGCWGVGGVELADGDEAIPIGREAIRVTLTAVQVQPLPYRRGRARVLEPLTTLDPAANLRPRMIASLRQRLGGSASNERHMTGLTPLAVGTGSGDASGCTRLRRRVTRTTLGR